jgi:hypothetical protein
VTLDRAAGVAHGVGSIEGVVDEVYVEAATKREYAHIGRNTTFIVGCAGLRLPADAGGGYGARSLRCRAIAREYSGGNFNIRDASAAMPLGVLLRCGGEIMEAAGKVAPRAE